MFRRKVRRYRPYFDELHVAAVECVLLIWSLQGRIHPSSFVVLRRVVDVAARREGYHNSCLFERDDVVFDRVWIV